MPMEPTGATEYIRATYALQVPGDGDVLELVRRFAVGQSTGTWLPVPGLTPQMRDAHEARVLSVQALPAADTTTSQSGQGWYLAIIGIPAVNVGASIPQLLTTLIGNDASTSMAAKLVDVDLPGSLLPEFAGPRFGAPGLRELTGVSQRPLLLNMVKPCTGLTPEAGAEIVYRTALGGIDLIKDDELLGNTEFSPVTERVRAYNAAIDRAAQVTGTETLYFPNVTDRVDRMIDTARRAVEAGARGVMVCYAAVGYGGAEALAEAVEVPVLGHFAAAAPYFEGAGTGMGSVLASGLLPRLAGADLALVNTPYGGYPITPLAYRQTAARLSEPLGPVRPVMPVVGGGVHPGTVARYVADLGADIVLGVGGAIQGHPAGPAAGVAAMRAAIDAALQGVEVAEAATASPELRTALELWGVLD